MTTRWMMMAGACVAAVWLQQAAVWAQTPVAPSSQPSAQSQAADNYDNEPWTWQNLFYGPMEIGLSPFVMLIGPVAGASGWSSYPYIEKDTQWPGFWASVGGPLAGFGLGLAMGPAVLFKGLFDTLTGGYWSDAGFFHDVTL